MALVICKAGICPKQDTEAAIDLVVCNSGFGRTQVYL